MMRTILLFNTCVFLIIVLGLPSGIVGWFDGLPWTNGIETIVLVIIPFFLIFGWRFLLEKSTVFFLSILLVFKIISFYGSPSSGWLIKLHPHITQDQLEKFPPLQNFEDQSWVKTYATSWNRNVSGILKKPWLKKFEFPMDWVLPKIEDCGYPKKYCFDQIKATVEIGGALLIPSGQRFSLIAKGVNDGSFLATNEEGVSVTLLTAKNHKEAIQTGKQLSKGVWKISGSLLYEGENWSLIPLLTKNNGEVNSDFGRGILWQDFEILKRAEDRIEIFKALSWIIDGGVLVFFIFWAIWIVRLLINQQILNITLAIFSILNIIIPGLMAPAFKHLYMRLGLEDPTTVSYLGFSLVLTTLSFLVWVFLAKDLSIFHVERIVPSTLLFFVPTMLVFFINRWVPILDQSVNWGVGDDWRNYQYFARNIVVDGEWLVAGEPIFIMQPFYRYFVGIYHWLFGQSPFTQHMADVWCIIGATFLIGKFSIKFRLSPLLIFIASFVYLEINLIGAFRYHIGRGLVENHAMIFIMLSAWFLYQSREGDKSKISLALIFGIFGFWMRLDHLGAIAGLGFLILEPTGALTGGWKGYWERFKVSWGKLVFYWVGGIFSIFLLCFRNWWSGGVFYLVDPQHPNLIWDEPRGDFYQLLTGVPWPSIPPVSGVIITIGTFISLLCLVWRPRRILNFPLSLGIILIGAIVPYFWLTVTGYPPRFSIHLIPFAILALAFFLNYLLKEFKPVSIEKLSLDKGVS